MVGRIHSDSYLLLSLFGDLNLPAFFNAPNWKGSGEAGRGDFPGAP